MATKPISAALPADLPTNWQTNQIISPTGTDVGLDAKHGYNYQAKQINDAQTGVNAINDAFPNLGDAPVLLTATFPTSGWVKNSGTNCYEQTVSAAGLLTTDGPKTTLILPQGSTDAAAQLLTDAAYGAIFAPGGYAACSVDGRLYARGPAGGAAPTSNFTVNIVVRR